MKKFISILLTTSMLAGSAAMPFAAIAAETVTTASRASEATKTGTLTVTVYNEDEGGLYTDEHISFMICGSPDQPGGPEMGGATFLCDVTPSESNPFVLNDIDIVDNFKYTIVDSVSQDHDGYNYYIDHERSDKTFRFTENPNQDLSIYMKKNYFIVHSDTSITKDKYGEENIKNINEVDWLLRDLINSDSFKVRDMAKRQYLAKSMLMSLCEFKMIADWSFDEAENVMSFTYNCGMTGQLRPAIFEDEHKQLENVDLVDAAGVVRATILEIRDYEVIIKPVRGSWESWAVGSKLALSTGDFNNSNITPTLGMKLEITYNKGFLENSPAEFENVLKIKVLSEDAGLIKGDANCDEDVDMSDVVLIMQALANPNKYGESGTTLNHLTGLGKLNGDMNGDGLTSGDALAIQRKLLGLDDEEKSFSTTLLGIDKAKVIGVKVSSLPEGYDYSFTDENAQSVVDYLSNISLSTNLSVEDPGQLGGMTWVIRLVYENGDTVTLYDLGKFIHGTDRKWYEMTYEESQELSNLIWKLGQTDNDKSIDNSAIAGKIFAYEKEGAGGYCTLSFNENGRFLYSPGKLSSYMGGGDWKIDGDTVRLIGMENKAIYLKITDDTLVYIAEGSDEFPYMDIKDGEKFGIYRPEISSDKFQLNSRYSEYGLGNPKVELNLIASELPEFCYVENVRLYDEDDNFIGMMSPAMDTDIWSYLVDCNVTEECSKTYYTLTKIRCGQKTYLDDVRSEINVNFKATPAP